MHLVQTELLDTKDLPSLLCQLDLIDGTFPAVGVASDLNARCSCYYLMAEADPYYPFSGLC
jgi:hypothetical protein